ncbi:ComEC/Rec2 family competence protein [Demequina sp.]|uniref:ComEC/Rec2 family competence protein n=1 Tax=Demequina sp. TaxID=2050685 RepID=UPI003A8B87DC
MRTRHDARLLPVALAVWIAAGMTMAGHRDVAGAAVTACLIVAAATLSVRRWRVCAPVTALASLAACCAVLVASAHVERQQAVASALVEASPVTAVVRVNGQPRAMGGDGGWMVPVTLDHWTGQCGLRACGSGEGGPLTVNLADEPVRGQRLVVNGTVTMSERGEPIMWRAALTRVEPHSIMTQWRLAFREATATLEPRQQGLVRGMLIGDTAAMPASQVGQMRTAGLAHLTAVSGAHFAVVIAGLGALMGAARTPRWARTVVVLVVGLWLTALVGPDPSVVRALAMAVAVALGVAWGRPARGFAALCAGVTVLVLLSPSLAVSFGFAMSVLAVAAIVLWAPVLAWRMGAWLPPRLARVASVPVAAYCAVLPVLVLIDPAVTPYAVVANVLAGIAVLPLMAVGMSAVLLTPVAPALAAVAARVAGLASVPIDTVAATASALPWARVPWASGLAGAGLAGLALASFVVASMRWRPGMRRWGAAVGLLCVAVAWWLPRMGGGAGREALEGWDVVACDVGQGDMMLLRAGPAQAVVIDTGPAADVARACLEAHGVREVPLLVVTHPHADHDGGVAGVLAVASVGQAWINAESLGTGAARLLEREGVPIRVPERGERFAFGDADLTVLSALHAEPESATNDGSVVVLARAQEATVLALGDLEPDGQTVLASALSRGVSVDAVKVAHHGSAAQDPGLIALIDARVALVSAGEGNRYGHPTPQALALYGAGAQVLRTDTCGPVGIAREGQDLRWTACQPDVAP